MGTEQAARFTLTAHQWDKVRQSKSWLASTKPGKRIVSGTDMARTLMSSYRRSFQLHSEFVAVPHSTKAPAIADAGTDPSHLSAPRFFTQRECARLMGFPETFRVDKCDNANRFYHQIGNAVCPPIIAAVAGAILRALESVDSGSGAEASSRVCGEAFKLLVSACPLRSRDALQQKLRPHWHGDSGDGCT